MDIPIEHMKPAQLREFHEIHKAHREKLGEERNVLLARMTRTVKSKPDRIIKSKVSAYRSTLRQLREHLTAVEHENAELHQLVDDVRQVVGISD